MVDLSQQYPELQGARSLLACATLHVQRNPGESGGELLAAVRDHLIELEDLQTATAEGLRTTSAPLLRH